METALGDYLEALCVDELDDVAGMLPSLPVGRVSLLQAGAHVDADGAAGMHHNVDLVRTIREVVGDGVDIMGDAYMGWNLDYARRMIPLLEKYNLRWLEEPVIPDDLHGYVELKNLGRIPIAGGEHAYTQYEVRDMLEMRAVDYVQIDTNRVGGISQSRKIAAMAGASRPAMWVSRSYASAMSWMSAYSIPLCTIFT